MNVESLNKHERNFTVSKQDLIQLIEKKREELIKAVSKNGLNSAAVIRYSQELDHLLNEFNRSYSKHIQTN